MPSHPEWTPPALDGIVAALDRVRANHPETTTLTIRLKLRTTRFKEEVLTTAQQRITSMKSEVLNRFGNPGADVAKRTPFHDGKFVLDDLLDRMDTAFS